MSYSRQDQDGYIGVGGVLQTPDGGTMGRLLGVCNTPLPPGIVRMIENYMTPTRKYAISSVQVNPFAPHSYPRSHVVLYRGSLR